VYSSVSKSVVGMAQAKSLGEPVSSETGNGVRRP